MVSVLVSITCAIYPLTDGGIAVQPKTVSPRKVGGQARRRNMISPVTSRDYSLPADAQGLSRLLLSPGLSDLQYFLRQFQFTMVAVGVRIWLRNIRSWEWRA